jgi:twinkle protein
MIIVDIDTQLLYEIYPSRSHGENAMTCPACSKDRRKAKDKCFSWNADNRVGRCNHCQHRFMEHKALKERPVKEYKVPQWKNITDLTDKAVKFFEGRMISQATLKKMRVYSDREFMPQHGKEVDVVCFPYFVDGSLRNIKYRGPQKSFRIVSGAELVLYNLDCVTPETSELVICEGEMDALSFIDAGIDNVVSVPNGAGSANLEYLDDYIGRLDHIKTFYIAADFDDAGLKLRNELLRRLTAEKCRIVTYEGHKDANDLFKAKGGLALRSAIENAAEVPADGVISLFDCYDDIVAMYHNGLPRGEETGIREIDEHIRWQTSRLAVWTGIPSHGKSEMLDMICLKLCLAHGWRTVFFSPENFPLVFHYAKLAKKLVGKKFDSYNMTMQELDDAFDYISDNFFWLDPYTEPTLDRIIERAEYHVRRYGVKQLVIDPFNCLEHQHKPHETGSEYVGRFLDELSRFAKKNDVLVHLVAHPTKLVKEGGKYPPPTLYDISGSANFYNKADYGITIYREFDQNRTRFIPTKVRFNNLGQPNKEGVELQYNFDNGRYQAPVMDISNFDRSNWLRREDATPLKTETPPLNFDKYDDDETPF